MEPLTDSFGRTHTYLRISVTDRCNFRCRYCMPPNGLEWLPRTQILTLEEIERLAGLFVRIGVGKIRLTGGEPSVRRGLNGLIANLASIPGLGSLHMTTNGSTLAQNAASYKQLGLNGVNVSLDSLRRDRFAEITMRDELDRVLQGVDAALQAGIETVKINVVLMAGVNEDEILDFVELTRDRPVNVRFIEFMPFLGNGWSQAKLVPYAAMRTKIESRYRLDPVLNARSEVGKDFEVAGHLGRVGFVTSMTESFCGDCNRIRLSAEGGFKTCLFSGTETNLRDPMRQGATDEDLERIIRDALNRKWKEHPPMDALRQIPNKSMVAIGG